MQQVPAPAERNTKKAQRLIFGVLTTLFLGAVGSGIWEVLFRPGLSFVGQWLASASTWFENEIYTTAALDPQPLPGLIGLLLLCSAPMFLAGTFVQKGFIELTLRERAQRDYANMKLRALNRDEVRRMLRSKIRVLALAGILVCAVFSAITFVGFTLQNEATKVWRITQANLEVVAARAADSQIRELRGQFRSIQGKADFHKVRDHLNALAEQNGLRLQWYGL